MKRNISIFVIATVWMGLMSVSCSYVKWVSVDRLAPAKVSLPERVRRVAVLNNQPVDRAQSGDSAEAFRLDAKAVADTLAQYLADAAYFDEVVVSDTVLPDNALLYSEGRELRPTAVAELCKAFAVDMLVTVDDVSFKPYGMDLPFVKGQLRADVTCYEEGSVKPVATVRKHYTFDWEHWSELKSQAVRLAALWTLPTLVPQWQAEDFPIYTGANVGQRDAAVYVREGNWEGAASLWRQQLTHKNRRRRMEAHLNMAVYHEVKDDSISIARTYAQKAFELSAEGRTEKEGTASYDNLLISDYMKEMERRGRDLESIKRQMHRFSDDF